MPGRQFVAVKYREENKRSYTFHYDGETLSVGDRVSLGTGFGIVSEIDVAKPTRFETKAITGLAPKAES